MRIGKYEGYRILTKNLTANGVLLKYLINAKNVNFFVYFFYFCFLAYTSAASCFNIEHSLGTDVSEEVLKNL